MRRVLVVVGLVLLLLIGGLAVTFADTGSPQSVPEPAVLVMLGVALLGLAYRVRR